MKKKVKIYELIVVGGGPAGVAAAVRAKANLSTVLLIEKRTIGGKVNEISLVNDYTSTFQIKGKKLGLMMKKQLAENRVLVRRLEVTSVQKEDNLFIIREQNHCFYSYSVVIATGSCWKELKLEKTKNIHHKNFSYRAASDAYLTKDKAILVVGGGYSGCQTADFLSNFAKRVYLVHRGEELGVDFKLKSRILENSKIKVYLNSIPEATGGEEELESCTISFSNGLQRKLKVRMVFPCIGTMANSRLVREVVDCTETGDIKVDNNFQTSTKGLFATGDVTLKNNSQITAAIAEGSQVAQAVTKYLLEKV